MPPCTTATPGASRAARPPTARPGRARVPDTPATRGAQCPRAERREHARRSYGRRVGAGTPGEPRPGRSSAKAP
eukprot:6448846-Pyramimonas_sp.AAC.1